MGEVYRARDTRLGREVAVKVLPEGFASDPDRLRRFEQEARAAAALNHPNILAVYDVGTHEGSPYVVCELLEGRTLGQALAAGPLPLRRAVELGVQLARGLAAAHEKGIVHRDLKPENLFLTKDGRLKILDFGLAKLAPRSGRGPPETAVQTASLLTAQGEVLGTVGYMAPEQVRGLPADHRSDLFAFGTILYEALTGRQAFRGDSPADILASILREDPPSLREERPDLPPAVGWVVEHCLKKDPEERLQSAQDIAFALEEGVGSGPVSHPSVAWPGARRRPRRWLAVSAVALLLLVAALLAGRAGRLRDLLSGGAGGAEIRSLAVLPLANLSADPDEEYFADGMTEALIADLAKIGALKVISRTSVMQYRGTRKPLPQIARELNVDAVVEGSVARSGDRVRITAQLIEGVTDTHLWADSYERDLRDVLALQSEVARAIAREIRATLTPGEETRLASARPVDPEAHQAYLRGRYHWNKRTFEGLQRSIQHFEEALGRDPSYALAYVGLADSYALLGDYGYLPAEETYPKAKAAARRALELDETIAEAHASLGLVLFSYDWDWVGAEGGFRRAIDLNPGYATAHHWYAIYLAAMGRHEEALAEIGKAEELDPLSLIIQTNEGWILYFARRYEEALERYRAVIALDPRFVSALWKLTEAYGQIGRYEEALQACRAYLQLLGWDWSPQLAFLDALWGREAEAREILREMRESADVRPHQIAAVHGALGDLDEAFAWLERAYGERDVWLRFLKVDPMFDPLRDDPRYTRFLERLGLS